MEPDAPTDKADAQSEDPLYEEAYMFVIENKSKYIFIAKTI